MGEAKLRRAGLVLAKWTPFERAVWNPEGFARDAYVREVIAAGTPAEYAEVMVDRELARLQRREVWRNSRYQVDLDRDANHGFGKGVKIAWLSIKRLDREAIGRERFRDFQRIKNELVDPEAEAMEIYPAESRLVDTSNQYHLWVFAPPHGIPVGWTERLVIAKPSGGAVQQPFEEESTT